MAIGICQQGWDGKFPYKDGYVLHVCCAYGAVNAAHVQAALMCRTCASFCHTSYMHNMYATCVHNVLLAHMHATGMLHKCLLHICILNQRLQLSRNLRDTPGIIQSKNLSHTETLISILLSGSSVWLIVGQISVTIDQMVVQAPKLAHILYLGYYL